MGGGPVSEDVERVLAAGQLDTVDTDTLAELRTILEQSDPVPTGLVDRIQFAMTVAALEAEVARIADQPVGSTRGTAYQRATTMSFESEGFAAMVTIEERRGNLAGLHGWTSPDTEIELSCRGQSASTTSDEEGRFDFALVERGLTHLVFHRPGSTPIITPAFEI